uniref:Uncharacterized protein n=1 Tax=Callorhinchus milii TaxID=7868 RepID=A0A4W3IGH3_CALMI
MWALRRLGSPRALITLPRARRPLLIWMDSFSRSPAFPVRTMRSEPAKSTKWNLEIRSLVPSSAFPLLSPLRPRPWPRRCSMVTVKIEWERLERGLTSVAPVCLAVFPISSKLSTSSRPSTSHSFTPHSTATQPTSNTP